MRITDISRFKNLGQSDMFKGLISSYSNKLESYGFNVGSQTLSWYFVDKSESTYGTDDMDHLFYSFGISRLDSGSTLAGYDLVDVFNSDRMIVAAIPQSGCGTYIDGSTLELRVPIASGTNNYVTFYGASYNGYTDDNGYLVSRQYDSDLFGSATVFLFPGWVGPYTGNMNGHAHPNSGCSTWIAANTDSAALYPHLAATHWTRSTPSASATTVWDIPHGIAFLEKGIFVIFDSPSLGTTLVNTLKATGIWNSAYNLAAFANVSALNGITASSNRDNICFTGTNGNTNARLIYRTVTQDYKMIYFCHAGQGEFNSTSNYTYAHRKAFYRPEEADSLYVTEIGLYDDSNVLLAYAKLSEPVEKNSLETITFKVELNI